MFHGFLTMDLQMNMNLEKARSSNSNDKLLVPIAWERGEYTCMASRANICCTLGMATNIQTGDQLLFIIIYLICVP